MVDIGLIKKKESHENLRKLILILSALFQSHEIEILS
jgi:hypothetical protein